MFDELTHQTGAITMATKRPGMEMKSVRLVTATRRPSIFFIGLGLRIFAKRNATISPEIARKKVTGWVCEESDTGQLKEICNP